jgi:hypothetical protein
MALHHSEPRSSASDLEVSFSIGNEQLNKIPVIVKGFRAYSDTSELPTVVQINSKGNDSDTVLIDNNINSGCKSSAQYTLTVIVTVSTLVSHFGDVTLQDVQAKLKTSLTRISVLQDL